MNLVRIQSHETRPTMRMSHPILPTTAAIAALILTACLPPPNVPPPRFSPNPPYPPRQVDEYGQSEDPYGQQDDSYGQRDEPTPPQQPTRPGEYPTARKTANANEVISPYEPYNIIDVEGFSSGQLARDPSNQKIFRIP